jgi:hypothetical protein
MKNKEHPNVGIIRVKLQELKNEPIKQKRIELINSIEKYVINKAEPLMIYEEYQND